MGRRSSLKNQFPHTQQDGTPRLSDNNSKWHNQPFVKSYMESEKAPTYVKTIVATTVEVKVFFAHFQKITK